MPATAPFALVRDQKWKDDSENYQRLDDGEDQADQTLQHNPTRRTSDHLFVDDGRLLAGWSADAARPVPNGADPA
jgi:hypothetical protein